jgi:ribonucleoside-triphosphate reductase
MQIVAINLPQIAFECGGKEGRLYELLGMRIWRARQLLLLKKQIVEKNLANNLLPFLSQDAGDGSYLNTEFQSYVVGFVGLNELTKLFTGFGLSQDAGALDFGVGVVKRMKETVVGLREDSGINFVLAATPSMKCGKRLCEIDRRRFGREDFNCYTNSFRPAVCSKLSFDDVLRVESPFHQLCFGGAVSSFPIDGLSPDRLVDSVSRVVSDSSVQAFNYV